MYEWGKWRDKFDDRMQGAREFRSGILVAQYRNHVNKKEVLFAICADRTMSNQRQVHSPKHRAILRHDLGGATVQCRRILHDEGGSC